MRSAPRRLLRALVLLAIVTFALSIAPSGSAQAVGEPEVPEVTGEGAEVRLRWRAAPDDLTPLTDRYQADRYQADQALVRDLDQDLHSWAFTDAALETAVRGRGTAALQPGLVGGALLAAAADGFLWHRRRTRPRAHVVGLVFPRVGAQAASHDVLVTSGLAPRPPSWHLRPLFLRRGSSLLSLVGAPPNTRWCALHRTDTN